MDTCLSHTTALCALRAARVPAGPLSIVTYTHGAFPRASSAKDIRQVASFLSTAVGTPRDMKPHITVSSVEHRSGSNNAHVHLNSSTKAATTLVLGASTADQAEQFVLCSGPAALLVQMGGLFASTRTRENPRPPNRTRAPLRDSCRAVRVLLAKCAGSSAGNMHLRGGAAHRQGISAW